MIVSISTFSILSMTAKWDTFSARALALVGKEPSVPVQEATLSILLRATAMQAARGKAHVYFAHAETVIPLAAVLGLWGAAGCNSTSCPSSGVDQEQCSSNDAARASSNDLVCRAICR